MSGAASRSKGHRAELAVAKYLRERGYPDACTTRSKLGHDGAHAPGDVVGPVGLVIEVKDVAASAWPSWCRQAEAEAGGRAWVVVRKTRGVADPGKWTCVAGVGWEWDDLRHTFGTFLDWFEDAPVGRERAKVMSEPIDTEELLPRLANLARWLLDQPEDEGWTADGEAVRAAVAALSASPAEPVERDAAMQRLGAMVDAWDLFYDECFPDDPFTRGLVHAEVDRLAARPVPVPAAPGSGDPQEFSTWEEAADHAEVLAKMAAAPTDEPPTGEDWQGIAEWLRGVLACFALYDIPDRYRKIANDALRPAPAAPDPDTER